ncbi:Protein fuzzy [Eumeta japonica]|uniref:Protein fuzzy n=1 Tax=Eumeta variegata TaxID=151549 RepID=A0A4C1YW55_EUMVA|nr:Protein fuzzy [Eumeta japonica]
MKASQWSKIGTQEAIGMGQRALNQAHCILRKKYRAAEFRTPRFVVFITLIGIVQGGLECDLELLLSTVYDAMIFYIGKKELENLKNIDQIKRELRQCYPILDSLVESLDPTAVNSGHPTLVLDLIECLLCPQAQQLQQVLDNYTETIGGRWACLSIYGRVAATSSDWCQLDPREARLLVLISIQDGAPLRETPVFLPYMSPNVAYRAVTCKLLADVYIVVVCGPTPPLSQIDELVLACWENYAPLIKEAKLIHPRNIPESVKFESCVLGVLVVNISSRKCVFSCVINSRGKPTTHRLDTLRSFYVKIARDVAPELNTSSKESTETLEGVLESYWCSEYHKCHARRSGNVLCCALYAATVPTHTMRLSSYDRAEPRGTARNCDRAVQDRSKQLVLSTSPRDTARCAPTRALELEPRGTARFKFYKPVPTCSIDPRELRRIDT